MYIVLIIYDNLLDTSGTINIYLYMFINMSMKSIITW